MVERGDAQAAAPGVGDERAAGDQAEQCVEREQHEVVRDDRAREPEHDAQRVADHVEHPRERVGGDRDAGRDGEQVQRAGAVLAAEGVHANLSSPTHLVQCTPGIAGIMMRAG